MIPAQRVPADADTTALATAYVAHLLDDMAKDAVHDGRRSEVLDTAKGDTDARMYAAAAILLRQLRDSLNTATEAVR